LGPARWWGQVGTVDQIIFGIGEKGIQLKASPSSKTC